MALYALFIVGSNSLAPILAGFIDVGQGWQWVLVSSTSGLFIELNAKDLSTGPLSGRQ